MKLPEFAVKQPVATLMMFLALSMIGAYAITRLSVDMFPQIDPPVISILTSWPGASASDVESEVTETIEDWVNTVNNLDTMTSKSLDNLSVISCRFDWGSDLDVASNDIRDQLEMAKRHLPDDIEKPILFKFSSSTAPILFISVTGPKSWPRLFQLVDKEIVDALKRVPGVGGVMVYGGPRRQINVYFDMARIQGYHLSLAQINRVLEAENLNIPAGSIEIGSKDYYVRIPGRYQTMDEIQNTIVGYFDNRPIYLKDIATVNDDYETIRMNAWGDGEPGILLILQKQTGKNTVDVIERAKKKLEEFKKTLPSDVQVNIVIDSSEDILSMGKNLRVTLYYGIFFVICVSIFFLRRIRTSFIIVATIPSSLIIAFIFLFMSDMTINIVSLMALAVASGMVVDNAIVVLENITRHMEKGASVKTSAMFGASEMGLAVTASTMTTVVVFVPLMFLTGLPGIIFGQMGYVVTITLMGSLLASLMLTPMMASKMMTATSVDSEKTKGLIGRFYAFSENVFLTIERAYGHILEWALIHRKTVIFLSVAVFMSSLSLIPFLSTSFLPQPDTGQVGIRFRLSEGTRLEETDTVMAAIMENINETIHPDEMRHMYGIDGQTEEGFAVALGFDQGPNIGAFGIKLVDRTQRRRTAKDVAAALRERVRKIPDITDIQVRSENPLTAALLGAGKPVSLEIQGTNLDDIMDYAQKIKTTMAKIPGLVDIGISQKPPRPEIRVEVDRKKASDLGLNIAAISGALRNYFYGIDATEFKDSGDSFDIFTRLSEKDKNWIQNLYEAPIFSPTGKMIPLKNIATIVESQGPVEIQRKNRQKLVKVEADFYKRELGEVATDLKKALKVIGTPPGISVKFGGDVEEQGKAFKELNLLLILGIAMVYMIMAALFGNLRDPLIIMFSVPFAFSGVTYAFYLTGTTLGMMSFMGIIMLMGIVVNNAIVLLDYTHLLQKRGVPLFQAVTEAGRHRLRPVLMTTLTTLFGLIPMAASNQVGAEAWKPMGITMLGGLSLSTLVTLILIPTIYFMFEKRKSRVG